MMMGPEIDVGALPQLASENLRVLLRKIPGGKDLLIEPCLMRPLDRFAAMSLIKSCGVNRVFRLEDKCPEASLGTRVYLLTPDVANLRTVIKHFGESRVAALHLVFVPKCLHQAEVLLEQEGLTGHVTVHEFPWQLIPLDFDVLSLEFRHAFRQVFCQEDTSVLPSIAKSLIGVQALFGSVGHRVALGRHSVTLMQQLELLEADMPAKSVKGEIASLFVVDRNLDYAACLFSPLTYESLLDEVFGINCGSIELDGSDLQEGPDAGPSKQSQLKLPLTSKDKIFEKIRNKHFASIFSSLSSYAKQIKHHQSRANNLSIAEMKQFVQNNLKDLQSQSKAIAVHISAAELIQNQKGPLYEMLLPVERDLAWGTGYKEALSLLEDLMAQMYPIDVVLRLLCLVSLCCQGLLAADHDRIKTQFLQAYGFEHVISWERLRQMGLLCHRDTMLGLRGISSQPATADLASFQLTCKKLSLVSKALPDTLTTDSSTNPSYVFNGLYTPLTCKLVLEAFKPTNPKVKLTDILKDLNIPSRICTPSSAVAAASKVVMIFFVGGYTMAEVASFRMLQANTGLQFIVAGTCNITGKSILNSICQL